MSTEPEFKFNPNATVDFEGPLEKVNVKWWGDNWQIRLFKLQNRVLYYYKKETDETPVGYIPLRDVVVSETNKKDHGFAFQIQLKNPQMSKKQKSVYILSANSKELQKQWMDVIDANISVTLVRTPYLTGCTFSTSPFPTLLPYFAFPVFQHLDSVGTKMRDIWTVSVPASQVEKGCFELNQNMPLEMDDCHCLVAIMKEYLKQLPQSFIPAALYKTFSDPNPQNLRSAIIDLSAPYREFLRMVGNHFRKVLDNSTLNRVSKQSLFPIVGPLLIRPPEGKKFKDTEVKTVQDKVADVFLENANEILNDVHQLQGSNLKPVIYKGRLVKTITGQEGVILEGNRNLLVNVVREDSEGWCTCFLAGGRVGLMHKLNIKKITGDDQFGGLDEVRERIPEMILLFDSMIEETERLEDVLKTLGV